MATEAQDRATATDTLANIVPQIAGALTEGALPGELDGFDGDAATDAATFVAEAAAIRRPNEPAVRLESLSGESARRRMRLAIVNDDMPFLVDSVSGALASRGIDVHRLLHPVLPVRRDGEGKLTAILPADAAGERRESMIYMELDRADARVRRAIETELNEVLADVRAAVADWPALREAMKRDAETLGDGEGAALLRWLGEGHFTFLGHAIEQADGTATAGQGVLRTDDSALWPDHARAAAIAWLERGGEAPVLLKSVREASVHRRAALDLVVVPVREGGRITGLSIHAGLWTSAALRAPSTKLPRLRARLAALEEKYGFDPQGHAGKALRHALSALPHELLTGVAPADLERLALTAMSLADRPRPRLMLVPDVLGLHLFAFVWLPREAVSTDRRQAIGALLAEATGAELTGWSIDRDEGDLALLRFTLDPAEGAPAPDEAALDAEIEAMLRGWAPAVEEELAAIEPGQRATRLALAWAERFPAAYRSRAGAREAAIDTLRLGGLEDDRGRAVRLYRAPGDDADRLRVNVYRIGGLVPLSEAVPVFENFGFRVLEELPTKLGAEDPAYIHEFLLQLEDAETASALLARAEALEAAIAGVLAGRAENDGFNALMAAAGLDARGVVLFRAWFRYLRQTGLPYGLTTVADALRRSPDLAKSLIALFDARHDPAVTHDDGAAVAKVEAGLAAVASIDDDRVLRRLLGLIEAILRTNAFTPAAEEALAFKLESAKVPGLPRPVPWREIWVYSPRVEGIHLRGGPVARGGLRWSDRRDDFRTEILGLMKAQVVKNAVIVPTGAKGGFYPKQLPSPADRDAWMAEGTESYRIFIRTLLSVTDNLVEGAVTHPEGVVIRDGDDPYFVVAADKGTATFSDVANAIALEKGFWLGDAFASGGSVGYDHKAMGITAKGAWVSVQRHFAERGVDVQSESIRVVGCGDMSGDVFGNGMLLSKTLKIVAAFDHRHFFLDPDPDPAKSWEERNRMFALPRSSWADYDASLISAGGGVFPRSQKQIPLSPEVRAVLGVSDETLDPASLIQAILKSPADLIWFGGIGTYVKARAQSNADVGDPANDSNRVDAEDIRAVAIGEGANLGVTQAARIAFSLKGGRINTDFIDNSAGVDCSDNEVNIKIALNREMIEGRLAEADRNTFLAEMTDDVAKLVLEDNRLQTLALSLSERRGAERLPAQVRVIEILEAAGRIDRAVDGLEANDALIRRAQEHRGLTRPELAIIMSHGKLALQAAIEASPLAHDPLLRDTLHAAFPPAMQARFADAIDAHRLAGEIVATKLSNRVVNRLGLAAPFELAEEEGASMASVTAAYAAADALFGLAGLFADIEAAPMAEEARLFLLEAVAGSARLHVSDILRVAPGAATPGQWVESFGPGIRRLEAQLQTLLRQEARTQSDRLRQRLADAGAPADLADRVVHIVEMDGAVGTASLSAQLGIDEIKATNAYVKLGEALGLDWAKAAALRDTSTDPWERLLAAGLVRDFEQLRLDFLARHGGGDAEAAVDAWLVDQEPRVAQFRALAERIRTQPTITTAMLAQLAGQARVLLGR
ncbi:NAD-glutamate dehydrogenase [Sphingomonas naphthae]|uniref:NAD-glutamate dehydrogenase n=1 Tax=Sphingomonas naphthae TaxID=1813468 RepID=A0ABY7TNU9_9SPHN|nr:NAD-glutamate dehydrogenase domain-containing protein [Sphingomonas naphthae]WCT74899.1 NAD-glutamate dehydrogenase [Sphingomonas naphthae]